LDRQRVEKNDTRQNAVEGLAFVGAPLLVVIVKAESMPIDFVIAHHHSDNI
jgi:hypothetical protein